MTTFFSFFSILFPFFFFFISRIHLVGSLNFCTKETLSCFEFELTRVQPSWLSLYQCRAEKCWLYHTFWPVQSRKMLALPHILASAEQKNAGFTIHSGQRRAEKCWLYHTFWPCLWRHWHRLPGTKWHPYGWVLGTCRLGQFLTRLSKKTAKFIIFNSIPIGKAHVATLLQVSFNVWTVSI